MHSRKIIIAAILAGVSPAAYAQSTAGAPAATTSTDDIVVTAQRREERLQTVPISIAAVGAAELSRRGATGTADLTTMVPGLQMSKSSTVPTPYLRGVGTANLTPGSDPSVPMYIDGVYVSAPSAFFFSFNNIERIEVLKGPQGTLFGRNSTGGLIQVITSDPKPGLSGKVSAGYGNLDTVTASAYVSAGNDRIAGDISVIYNSTTGGIGRNFYVAPAGGPAYPANARTIVGWNKDVGVRSKIVLTGETTTAKLSLMYIKSGGDLGQYRHFLPGNGSKQVQNGYTTIYQHGDAGEGFYDINSDLPWYAGTRTYLATAEIKHDAGFMSIKSITSYLNNKSIYSIPTDASPQVGTTAVANIRFNTYTQELQFLSNPGEGPDWLEWIGGAYYLHSRSGYFPQARYNGLTAQQNQYAISTNESLAGYFQATVSLPAEFKLTGGIRYTHDRYAAEQYVQGVQPGGTGANAAGGVFFFVPETWTGKNATTWRVALDKRITQDVMVYASASKGYKSGSWNVGSLCPTTPVVTSCTKIDAPVRPETLMAYEIGLRSDLFDNRLRFNLSAFHYKYKDLQIQSVVGTPTGPISALNNAASATIKGVEFDTRLKITPTLSISASGSYLDAKYDTYLGAIVFTPNPPVAGGTTQSTANASGRPLSRSPKFSSNVSFNWDVPTSIGAFNLSGTWYHTSKYYWEPGLRLVTPAMSLFNAQIAYKPTDNLQIRVWGKNLGDKQYYSYQAVSLSGEQGSPALPRTFGIAADYSF